MPDEPCELKPGDVCIHGVHAHPRYRVIHVHEGRAWLRDIDTGADGVVDVDHCHRQAAVSPAQDEPHHGPRESPLVEPPLGPGIRTPAGAEEDR